MLQKYTTYSICTVGVEEREVVDGDSSLVRLGGGNGKSRVPYEFHGKTDRRTRLLYPTLLPHLTERVL